MRFKLAVAGVVVVVAAIAVIQWQRQVSSPSIASTARTSASPNPISTATSSPSPSLRPTGSPCVRTDAKKSCGPYSYAGITGSNGFNTFVNQEMWNCPCGPQTLTAYDPGNWSVTSNQNTGNTAVLAYPDVQRIYSNPQLSAFASLTSSFTETMNASSGTMAEAAYDIWLNKWSDEVMIWVDNAGQSLAYDTKTATVTIHGQTFTLYQNGRELIVSLDQNEQTGTIDILAILTWLRTTGHLPASSTLTSVDFGWEISSTGGQPETFMITRYNLTSSCVRAATCQG